MPGITKSQSLLKLISIESVMQSNHLILCCPLLLLPSIFPSLRVFSNESALHIRWPKYWSFSFSISPSNEYSGLISFRMAWLDLLAVQGTLKSLLQHHSSQASILQRSALFIVQHMYIYIHTYMCKVEYDVHCPKTLGSGGNRELTKPAHHLSSCGLLAWGTFFFFGHTTRCGILIPQGSNLHFLHWKAES